MKFFSHAVSNPRFNPLNAVIKGISKQCTSLYRNYRETLNSVGTATRLRAARSKDRILVGGEIFRTLSDRPGAHPASYTMGTESFQRVKRPEGGVDNPPHPASRLKKKNSYTSTYLYFVLIYINYQSGLFARFQRRCEHSGEMGSELHCSYT